MIQRAGDLAALLTNLQPRDVLFIDEIHRLQPAVEEILYPAMEDFQLDLIIGEGPAARSVRIDLPPFTLVGATTRSGLLTTPLRERFGIPLRLVFYEPAELEPIVPRGARVLGFELTAGRRRRDRPARARHAARRRPPAAPGARLRRGRTAAASVDAGDRRRGADAGSRSTRAASTRWTAATSRCIAENYGGGPVGVETLAAALVRAARRDRGGDRALPDAAGPAACARRAAAC